MSEKEKNLTAREKLFCHCYLRTQNGREAAVRAGYPLRECRGVGETLLARGEIQRFIQRLSEEDAGPDPGRALRDGLFRLAFGPVADCVRLAFLEEAPDREDLEELDLFALCEFKRGKGVNEVKLYDRMQAMEALAALAREKSEGVLPLYEALERGANALRGNGTGL